MHFRQIVDNYGKLYRIGKLIIRHTNDLKTVCARQLDHDFEKQHARITAFEDLVKKADANWKTSGQSINKYWTGF